MCRSGGGEYGSQLDPKDDRDTGPPGPDGSGTFFDPDAPGIGFGGTDDSRLSTSVRQGSQPMWSQSGRYCITYNGEIYNAPEFSG